MTDYGKTNVHVYVYTVIEERPMHGQKKTENCGALHSPVQKRSWEKEGHWLMNFTGHMTSCRCQCRHGTKRVRNG